MDQVTTSPVRLPIDTALDRPVEEERRPTLGRRAVREAEESYRKAALSLSRMVANGVHSVLFCSARRGEGTTTAVLGLAHQLQENYGLRPLIIELTRHKPTLAKLFGLSAARTLDDALTHAQAATDCIQTTASGLFVIPGGSRRAGRTHPQLLSNLGHVLKDVEALFDVVLLDAPPLLTEADAIIAATVVPTVVLVVESGRTSYEVLERVKGELANGDIRIAGTVLVKHKRFIPRWIYWWLTR